MAKKDKKKKKNFQEKIYKGQIDPNLDEVADYWKVLFTVLPFRNFVKCWINVNRVPGQRVRCCYIITYLYLHMKLHCM